MAEKIVIEASDVWEYFDEFGTELSSAMHRIAENEEYGIEIFLTEERGFPCIVVEGDGMSLYEETIMNKADCESSVKEIYDTYL